MSHVLELNGKRYLIRDREDWQVPSRPVTGPSPRPDLVHHAVIHWPGAGLNWLPPKTFAQTAAHLRWANDMYLNDPARGYSYGYGFVIGQTPVDWNAPVIELDLWEVRGTDIRIASNDGDNGWYGEVSDPNFNGRSISCQLTASVGHPATNDQIETARVWVAMMDRVYGERLNVIAHRVSDQTTCPGEHINAQIGRIADRPTAVVPPAGSARRAAGRQDHVGHARGPLLRPRWLGAVARRRRRHGGLRAGARGQPRHLAPRRPGDRARSCRR
jgi:hypothetical protein